MAGFLLNRSVEGREWIVPSRSVSAMHKIGVLLTIIFLIVGFWDVSAIYQNEMFEHVLMPLLGILVVCGGLKVALNR